MKTVRLTGENDQQAAEQAAAVLKSGGVVLYPTDTLYGLGVDALSDAALDKVIAIKGRDEKKPIHAVVADLDMAARYAVVDDLARRLAKRFLPGALTLILKKLPGVTTGIGRQGDTFGIRMPNHSFCLELAHRFDGPYTTTSANRAGEQSMHAVPAILSQLESPFTGVLENPGIDLVIDAGAVQPSLASTIIDLSGERPLILREGAIASADIWEELRLEP